MDRDYKPSIELLARFLRKNCTPEEQETVERWLAAKKSNSLYLQELEEEWTHLYEPSLTLGETSRKRVWKRVQDNIEPMAKIKLLTPRKLWLSAVAVAVMALLVGGIAVYVIQRNALLSMMEGQLA